MNQSIFSCFRVRYLLCIFLLGVGVQVSIAQTDGFTIQGKVKDAGGLGLPGVSVLLKNSKAGTTTDADGNYAIKVTDIKGVLVFSFVGFLKTEVEIKGQKKIDVTLQQDKSELNEVVVVAYGQQKKESMVSSITAINPKEIKGPTSNLTTMLAGRLSGVVAYQRSGEPGADNAQFFIRGITTFGSGKVDPLILIDGMESTNTALARLQPDDIAGFSVLKDAAASSLYGARGANGVVLVTTKSGVDGRAKFNFRAENSVSTNTQNFKLADNITYMKLANEAVLTRTPGNALPYTQNKIDGTIAGTNPYLYPNNDWVDLLIKDHTMNQRFNMNMSGGGKVAQYYISGTYNQDNGVLKNDDKNIFNNNIKLKSYEVRSNVNVKFTPTTDGIVRTSGAFDDYTGPIGGGAAIFNSAMGANPVMFPARFPSSDLPSAKHPIFGNALLGPGEELYENPYASMVSGFQQYNTSNLNVQLEVKQDLKFLTEGLNARFMAYTQRYSYFSLSRQYNPFFYSSNPTNSSPAGYTLNFLNENKATEYLNYSEGGKVVNTTTYAEAAVNYNRTFGEKHNLSGLVIGIIRNYLNGNAQELQLALPFRNQGISGRFTYGYDNRYLFETNFGYNGSERFAADHRFGFFPSMGVAWNVNNEKFFKPLTQTINKLKFRATYGLVGNDQIGNPNDRFFYLSNVNMNSGPRGAVFGENYGYSRPGVAISRYSNNDITWEKAKITNIGMDLGLFNALNVVVDVYKQRRSNILMQRVYIPTTLGLTAPISANVGVAEGKGVDVAMDYNKTIGRAWLQARGTFTFATSKLLVNEEPEYPENMWYLSRVGHSLGLTYGLIAERLFVDDVDVANSPKQNFGEVRGGDIKYRDLNGDGQITNLDMINGLSHPVTPEITYGFGLSAGYGNFDISAFFQGSARSSLFIDPKAISPFVMNGSRQNGLLDVIAKDHWSEDNNDLYAFWPRLSSDGNTNNNQPSTWWMRNGSFLRLKTVELGYNFNAKMLKRLGIEGLRLYANGSNLFLISGFKMWDPEQAGNGLGYPLQKVFNMGLNVQF
ncbi:TonB-linked SusC/RagA family outer membrane protein [Pedobacter africanus]|uniref:TonB-linked SusC/RagA family outer membrane protein n=1 Tax=Pedobacter africanus TaxID=151894 RepID=A0ACC6L1V9_9SPHI|nr:TonB-dependent receptor [Pedobacter africanus]MDR6785298.1 TonB-linked SusC/RagA family outer membrane protein [Pedobacter africanus]